MMDTLIANPAVRGGGLNADARPFEIAVIVLPEQYSENKEQIEKFMRSGVLPISIRSPLEQFDSVLNDNASALIRVLNDASHNHREWLLYHDDQQSPSWKMVDKNYHDHFALLEPQVSIVLKAIRQFLGL